MPIRKGCFVKNDELVGIAILNNCLVAPRKMRLVADLIRGEGVTKAFSVLACNQKKCVGIFKNLLNSAVSNFQYMCSNKKLRIYNSDELYVSKILVDSASMLKRTLPAPHGRALRIRKRMSNLLIIVEPNIVKKNKGSVASSKETENVKKSEDIEKNKLTKD